jgi:hypothetical protein
VTYILKRWEKEVTNLDENFSAVNLKSCFPQFSGRFAVTNWNKLSPTTDKIRAERSIWNTGKRNEERKNE